MVLLVWIGLGQAGQTGSEWATNAILFGSLVVVREVTSHSHPQDAGFLLKGLAVPGLLFTIAVVWSLIQLSTSVPSGLSHPIWGLAGEALGKSLDGRITVDPELTRLAILRLMTVGCAFWIAAHVSVDAERGLLLLLAVAVIGALHGLYALANPVGLPSAAGGRGSLEGTFGNRNTLATYAGIGFLVATGLLWRRLRGHVEFSSGRMMVAELLQRIGGKGLVLTGSILILGATLLLTGSRGGVIATAAGLLTFLTLTILRRRSQRRGGLGRDVWVAASVLAVMAASFFAFGDLVAGRLSESGLSDGGRPFLFRTAWDAIASSPWLGYGYGTFEAVFPMFHDGSDDVWMGADSAHNTYLEVLLGLGIVGGGALIASIAWVAVVCFRGALTLPRSATLSAIAASVAILTGLHALVDFSLKIEAVAITSAIVLGVGFAQAARTPQDPASTRGRARLASVGDGSMMRTE